MSSVLTPAVTQVIKPSSVEAVTSSLWGALMLAGQSWRTQTYASGCTMQGLADTPAQHQHRVQEPLNR